MLIGITEYRVKKYFHCYQVVLVCYYRLCFQSKDNISKLRCFERRIRKRHPSAGSLGLSVYKDY